MKNTSAALLNAVFIIFTTLFIDSITAVGTDNEPALPLFQSLSEFHLDEESRLYNHYLLIANNRKCKEKYSQKRLSLLSSSLSSYHIIVAL